jgi:DNA replication protein DnaC
VALVDPPAPARSHLLVALGHAAVQAGHRVRYLSPVDLVETLYRDLADKSLGKVIESILQASCLH